MKARESAVHGLFYPARADQLRQSVAHYLQCAIPAKQTTAPLALVVPHAGYRYSGQVAANGFAALRSRADQIRRVLLLGPSHRVPLRGMAVPSVGIFTTPLGDIALDTESIHTLAASGIVTLDDLPHRDEHSLEVQLPFLQMLLQDWQLVPVVVGLTPPEQVAELLAKYIDDPANLVLISSDLSHFQTYEQARETDNLTRQLIEARKPVIVSEQACGCQPLNGLLLLAQRRQLKVITLDMKNSGDTAGDRNRVVGYGSYGFYRQ